MRRLVAALWLAAAPLAAGAQAFQLGRPDVAEALRRMDWLAARAGRSGLPEAPPLRQTFVLPERPGQNQVAWYDFAWEHLDVPSPTGGEGGVRLYFYRREREVAERALPVIRNAYLRLVDRFHYTPTKQIPYILYASQREFQATNVFQVNESVLGVTSPRDLKMSLPYFGDHGLFRDVSTHELVHQFTIQKLLDLAGGDDAGSPIEALPLWFIEGMAEWYAKGGIDPETDAYLADLVWNPDEERHYQVVGYADDRYLGYIPTYKLGQARVAFVAEVYGPEKIQGYLEGATLADASPGGHGFAALTRRVLDEPLEEVDARWRAWLKRRYYGAYRGRQDLAQLRELRDLPSEPEAAAFSPDGQLALFRGIDREAGRARLYLVDARYPRGAVQVAADSQPGVESLHPVEHSVMALGDGVLAYAAQAGPGDVLYVQRFAHVPPRGRQPPRLALGERRAVALRHPTGRRFLEISDPALSPDGRRIAFAGMTDAGQLDVYVVPVEGGPVRQLTDDPFAERDLAWGAGGIYCASDATDHGRFNLFRLDPETGARTRLTTGAWDDRTPRPQADGSVVYASAAAGRPDLYLLRDGQARRLTAFATGLTAPAVAPQARGIWASTFYRGRFRLVEVPRGAWLDEPATRVAAPAGPVLAIPRDDFPRDVPAYDPYALGNWRPEAGIVYGGGTSDAVAGRAALLFSDTFRDRVAYLDLAVYGSFEYTQALALLEDRSGRVAWVLGAFHFVQEQIDLANPDLAFLQREFGALGTLRFPLDRFRRWEVELSVGGVQRYCLTNLTDTLISCGSGGATGAGDWRARNGGIHLELGPTVRYGYDTVRYHPTAGPIAGNALLVEVGAQAVPWLRAVSGFARADAASYLQISGRAKLVLRAAAGTSFAPDDTGKTWSRTWWLTAADNLRGYSWNDLAYLIGRNYWVLNAEVQLPLDPVLRLGIFDSVFAVGAFDFGGVFNNWSTRAGCDVSAGSCADGTPSRANDAGIWAARTLTAVLGVNAMFGPLLLRVHFGHPLDIGGIRTPALRDGTSWVTNVTLRYFFF